MIDGVKQHKWWGWGEEGRSYHHDDKPKFAPFVKKLVGVDINAPVAPLPKLSTKRTVSASEAAVGSMRVSGLLRSMLTLPT